MIEKKLVIELFHKMLYIKSYNKDYLRGFLAGLYQADVIETTGEFERLNNLISENERLREA